MQKSKLTFLLIILAALSLIITSCEEDSDPKDGTERNLDEALLG